LTKHHIRRRTLEPGLGIAQQLLAHRVALGRHIAALFASLLAAAIAVALHLACREVVSEANDEVGRSALALGPVRTCLRSPPSRHARSPCS
jgi:hypothetical protein